MHTARFVRTLVTLLILATPAWAQQHGEESREQWQKVDEVIAAMGARRGAVVADLGAGDGFFTVRLARAVGEQGKVYAVDVSADALRRLRTRVANDKLAQVEVIEAASNDPRLPAGSLDAVLVVNAYHEMKAHAEILAKVKAALKPQGRLVIIEPIANARRDQARDAQTRNHEIGIDFVKQDLRDAGFIQVSMQDPFTTRATAHDDMWMLVAQPANPQTLALAAFRATKTMNWEDPALRISLDEFKRIPAGEALVLDVRDEGMFRTGHLPGAVLLTVEEIGAPEGTARLKNDARPIVTYCSCESEQTSARAALMLKAAGFANVRALVGGYEAWLKSPR